MFSQTHPISNTQIIKVIISIIYNFVFFILTNGLNSEKETALSANHNHVAKPGRIELDYILQNQLAPESWNGWAYIYLEYQFILIIILIQRKLDWRQHCFLWFGIQPVFVQHNFTIGEKYHKISSCGKLIH